MIPMDTETLLGPYTLEALAGGSISKDCGIAGTVS